MQVYFECSHTLQVLNFLFQPFVLKQKVEPKIQDKFDAQHFLECIISYAEFVDCKSHLGVSFRSESLAACYAEYCRRCIPRGSFNHHYRTTSGIRRWTFHLVRRVPSKPLALLDIVG